MLTKLEQAKLKWFESRLGRMSPGAARAKAEDYERLANLKTPATPPHQELMQKCNEHWAYAELLSLKAAQSAKAATAQ